MREPYLQCLVHLVWSTWDRAPLIFDLWASTLHDAMAAAAVGLVCHPVHVGGTRDHVHMLVGLPATVTIADLAQRIKGKSSHLVSHLLAPGVQLRWQGGYGAFTLDRGSYARCRSYVENQASHHSTATTSSEWETTYRP